MTPKKTPFLMAVVVATASLFWAQISAPTHLKPLTNHLLDYPGNIPTLTTLHHTIRVISNPTKHSQLFFGTHIMSVAKKLLPQIPTIAVTTVKYNIVDKGDKDAVVVTKPLNSPGPT